MSDDRRIEGLGELGNALEALVNVVYLIRHDRHDPNRVLVLTEMADAELQRMAQVLQREMDRPPTSLN
jgi:hypothetical protein